MIVLKLDVSAFARMEARAQHEGRAALRKEQELIADELVVAARPRWRVLTGASVRALRRRSVRITNNAPHTPYVMVKGSRDLAWQTLIVERAMSLRRQYKRRLERVYAEALRGR